MISEEAPGSRRADSNRGPFHYELIVADRCPRAEGCRSTESCLTSIAEPRTKIVFSGTARRACQRVTSAFVLPVLIVALIAIPLLVLAFGAMRRSNHANEHPASETDADRLRTEQEFEESERYQAEWRKEHEHDDDTLIH